MPLIRGEAPADWRKVVFSEYDYCMQDVRLKLNQPIEQCRLFMVFDGRWKYIHAAGFRPMLYDLGTDPGELVDRGDDPACAGERARLKDALLDWSLRDHNRITIADSRIAGYSEAAQLKSGIVIGFWDQAELDAAKQG
jgi:arylsulfatase A-like enzyme